MPTRILLTVLSLTLASGLHAQERKEKPRLKGTAPQLTLPSGGNTGFNDFKGGLGRSGSYASQTATTGSNASAVSAAGAKALETGGVTTGAGDSAPKRAAALTNTSGSIPGSGTGPASKCPTSCTELKGGLTASPEPAELQMAPGAQTEITVKGIAKQADTCVCYQVLAHPKAPQAVKDSPDCSKLANFKPFAEGNSDWKWKDGAWTGTVQYGDDLYGAAGIKVRAAFLDAATCKSGESTMEIVEAPPAGAGWECTDQTPPPPQPTVDRKPGESDESYYARYRAAQDEFHASPAWTSWWNAGGWGAACLEKAKSVPIYTKTVNGIVYTVYEAALWHMPLAGGSAHGKLDFTSAKQGVSLGIDIRSPESYGICRAGSESPAAPADDGCRYVATISKTPGGPPAGENCKDGPVGKAGGTSLKFGGKGSAANPKWSCILPVGHYYCNVTSEGYDEPSVKHCGGLVASPLMQKF